MTVYLGRPGALQVVPGTGLKVAPGLLRVSGSATTIGGGRVRDYVGTDVLRSWGLSWSALDRDLYGFLEAFFAGLNGPGPFVFLDPGRTNLLTANQSGATSVSNGVEGFTVGTPASEFMASDANNAERGPRCLAWLLPSAPVSGYVDLDPPNADWYGVPCVPGREYRFQCRIKRGSGDATVDLTAKLRWLDGAGAALSTSTGATLALSGAYQDLVVGSVTAPAGAVYAKPRIAADTSTVGAETLMYVDYPQLSMPDALDDGTVWRAGLGVPRVSLPQLDDAYWHVSLHRSGLVLEEVS